MKLDPRRRRSRARRAADAAGTLTKAWAGKKTAGATARGARRSAKTALGVKTAQGAARHPRAARRGAKGVLGARAAKAGGPKAAKGILAARAAKAGGPKAAKGMARGTRATVRGAAKGYRARRRGTTSRGRKLALLAIAGGLAGALAKQVKDRKEQAGADPAASAPPAPTRSGADLQETAPNRGATGLAPEAVHERSP